jgi:hypothetical protein
MATLFQLQEGLVKADSEGNAENVAVLSDAIREHPTYQKQSQDQLSQGFKALSGDEKKQAIHKHTARSLGIKESDLDSDRGMGVWGRTKLSFQATEQDKFKHLEDTYGKENLRGVDIGGDTQFLYRDEDETGGKWRRVDEQGASFADFTADLAGYVPEVAGAVAGGVKGAALGTLAGGPVGTVVGGVLGAAGAGFATATAQDVATRALSDEDIQLGEIAGRRGKEALIGAVADVALLGGGRVASKFLRKSGLRESSGNAFADSVETVRQAGGDVGETAGVKGGGKTLEKEMSITQARPSSKVAKINDRTRASMINLADEMSGKSTPSEAAARIAENAKAGKLDLEDFIRGADTRASKIISDAKLGSLERFSTLTDDMDRFGGDYKELLTKLGQGADETVKQKYALRDQLAEQLNVGVSKKKLLASIDAGIAKEPKFNNAAMKAARQRVEDGDDFIPFNDLDAELALVRDAIPDGAQTKSTGQRLASLVAEEVGSLRSKTARSAGTDFNRAFLDANKFVKEEALGFRRGAVGRALKEQVGDNVATNQDVARAVFKDAETVREVLQTASNADAFVQAEARAGRTADPLRSASQMEKDLRRQFMSQLGFDKGTTSASAAKLNKNQKEVMAQLWSGPNAKEITSKGRRKVAEYEQLMKKVEQSGVKVPQLGVDEVDEYLSAFSIDKRNKVKNELVARAKKREKLRIFEENTLIKKALKGEAGDHLRSKKFGDTIVGQTTEGQAKQFMGDIVPAQDVPFIRQNVIESLIAKSGGASGAGWDSKSMRNLLERQSGTLKAVLGKDDYKLINSINDVMERVQKQFTVSSTGEVRPRVIVTPVGIAAYLSGDIMQSIGNRFYGWAYGTGVLKDLFVGGSQKASKEAWDKALGKMIGTSQGLQALDHATSEDPDARGTIVEELSMQGQ